MMRVLVLGATGDMGRRASLDLAQASDIRQLTIASRSLDNGQALADEIGPKAQPVAIDARHHRQMVKLMAEHDVVAGAIGPYYLYEVPLAQAAIEARVPYVSICDDYDGAQGVLELNTQAEQAGVTILTGAGWTPGITNIMVKKAASLLDTADEAHISWAASAADSEGLAVLFHMLHILTGEVPTYVDGQWTPVTAGSGKQAVDFGGTLGKVVVYHVGHPEPVTIPRFMPQLKTVSLRGGLLEGYLNTLGLLVARSGLTRTQARRERVVRLLARSTGLLKKTRALSKPISGAHVTVHGIKDGRRASVTYRTEGAMAALTALPLSVATLMIGRGQISLPGVIAPETDGALDPDVFIKELSDRGVSVHGGAIEFAVAPNS